MVDVTLLRRREQSIAAPALLIKLEGLEVARVILTGITRIEFDIMLPADSQAVQRFIRDIEWLAWENNSKVEVKEDLGGFLEWINIVPALKTVNADAMTRRIHRLIAETYQELTEVAAE